MTFNQNLLFPVSLSEKIAPNHPVCVVNSVVDTFPYLVQDIKEKLSQTKNKELAEWVKGLKEEDNDVLILVRLK